MGSILYYDYEYIRITEFESGCYQIMINYHELENASLTPFFSREIQSGEIHWFLRYSNTPYVWPYNSMDCVALEVQVTTMHDQKKEFGLSLIDRAGKPVMNVTQEASAYNIIPLVIMKSFLEDVGVIDGWFFVECRLYDPETCSQKASLSNQLGNLLDSREMTDVTIEVKGELFQAHKLILGARSAVFRSQLFGPMVEAKSGHIKIEDMEAEVFRYILHYIYTDTIHGDPETFSIDLAQNLLIAADRYAIEGLQEKCEGKLCKDVCLDSVLSSLALAERHNCSKLKSACLRFATEQTNLAKLALTKEFYQFMQNFPELVAQLRKQAEQL